MEASKEAGYERLGALVVIVILSLLLLLSQGSCISQDCWAYIAPVDCKECGCSTPNTECKEVSEGRYSCVEM